MVLGPAALVVMLVVSGLIALGALLVFRSGGGRRVECKSCGAPNARQAKYCGRCGAALLM